jgi:hypothetical protein
MAQDAQWLGRDVAGKRSLIIDEENAHSLVHRRLRALGMTNDHREHLRYYCRNGILLGDPEYTRAAIDEAGMFGADLVIIDSALQATAVDVSDNGSVGKLYGAALRPLAELGCAVLLIHHPRKPPSGGQDGDPLNASMGAANWRNQADCMLGVRRAQEYTATPRADDHVFGHYACGMTVLKSRDGKIGEHVRVEVTSEHDAQGRLMWLRTSVGVDEAREAFQRWRDVDPLELARGMWDA